MKFDEIKFDCRYFKGGIPCKPNKIRNKVCITCDEYSPITKSILIIKLGALGDVIRTTPLVTRFRKEFPGCKISWITLSPSILPRDLIDEIFPFDHTSVYGLLHRKFDIALNLDKEIEACALLADVDSKVKMGFTWKDGHIALADQNAEHKMITGAFDNLSKANTKNYLEEIFEICGFKFEGEEYLMNVNVSLIKKWEYLKLNANGKTIVGLNTGCGQRWLTRLWPEEHWISLISKLQEEGFVPVLLGGKDEDAQNKKYADETGAYYPGTYSLEEFIAITANCDLIVSAVSMMMHIAVGLKKPLILFNNIFNRHEFHLYGRGEIVSPSTGCDCYYGLSCKRAHHCMNDLSPSLVFAAISKHSPVQK